MSTSLHQKKTKFLVVCYTITCNRKVMNRDVKLKNPSLHPGKLTWNPKMEVWKMMFLFNWVIFRFHVNFQGVQKSKAMDFCSLRFFFHVSRTSVTYSRVEKL